MAMSTAFIVSMPHLTIRYTFCDYVKAPRRWQSFLFFRCLSFLLIFLLSISSSLSLPSLSLFPICPVHRSMDLYETRHLWNVDPGRWSTSQC
ncbi:hypothetical protein CPC08DRAFT_311907 [Agrocybe pediades]|nr:hypothetical protein CPC08DRAFT_311907 [Agrocybe pediades]